MSDEMPPSPVPPTGEDRRIFRDRMVAALKSVVLSQRQAEFNIGMARGTISKIYSGRVALSLKTLRELAEQARVEPQDLVSGTGLAQVLLSSPKTPESDQLANAKAEVDRLRTEVAARDASIGQLTDQLKASRAELDAVRRVQAEEKEANVALRAEIDRRSAEQDESKRLAEESAHRAMTLVNQQRDQTLAEISARLGQTEKQSTAWRTYAIDRNARVGFLETELQKGFLAAHQRSSDEAGRLLLTALAGLGIGAVIAKS
jgi:transcriptional regulator with XRE-family HTH domain